MFSKAQFNGALRTIKSTDAKLREAVTGAVSFVVFHYVAHSKNITPRTQMLEATAGIRWLHAALDKELAMGNMPKPDKDFTAELADTWAAFAVSRVWDTQQAKREADKAKRKNRKAQADEADADDDVIEVIQATEPARPPVTVEGEAEVLDVTGPLLIGEDGTTMELSAEEYNACIAAVMKLRMTSLKAAA